MRAVPKASPPVDEPLRGERRLHRAAARPTLVIVGAGMAAQRLCERLVDEGAHANHRVVLLGEEREPPYDRIRLGERLHGAPAEELWLRPPGWYAEHGIELRLGARVVGIDRAIRCVMTAGGSGLHYDRLVLATGSRPRTPPPFDALDARVLTYRSATDVEAIAAAFDRAGPAPRCLVVGGGLLGLEVARDLQRRGGRPVVLEAASHLMSRQLDLAASRALREGLCALGIEVREGARVEDLRRDEPALRVSLAGGERVDADLAVVTVGVRPEDEVARRAGLRCHPRGGVWVDAEMRTDDPRIDAIGECAVFAGEQIGLVAPCYDMAEAVAARLAGKRARYRSLARVTKLKLDALEVCVVGHALADGPGFQEVVRRDEGAYRRLVVRRGKLVGATSVGAWEGLPSIVEGVSRRVRLSARAQARFAAKLPIWPELRDRVDLWSDEVPLCTCTGATCGAVRRAVADGCDGVASIGKRTGAGTVCGSCLPLLSRFVGGAAAPSPTEVPLAAAGVAALVTLAFALALGPLGYAASLESGPRLDVLWRDGALRQLSGFSLVGLAVLSLLVSLRKRVRWFRLGSFRACRLVHATLGVATIAGLGIHTGFRMGSHLDLALSSLFVGVVTMGAGAAIVSALEPRLPPRRAGALRRLSVRAHQVLCWPLPALVVLHALKGFYF